MHWTWVWENPTKGEKAEMKNRRNFAEKEVMLAILLMAAMIGPALSAPMGSAFTYQGQLKRAGAPANGNFDFRFRLYDALSGGAQVGGDVLQPAVVVNSGLFTVNLDFGASAFSGAARFLQIEVKPAGGGAYTLLTPRQELKPAPHTLYAGRALNATAANSALTAIYATEAANANYARNIPLAGTGTTTAGAHSNHGHFGHSWSGSSPSYGLIVENDGAGDGIRAFSHSSGPGYAAVWAVCPTTGTAVFAYSEGGDGVDASTNGGSKSAVYGHSGAGFGVTGSSTNNDGVVGWSSNAGHSGVWGHSVDGFGITGDSTNNVAIVGRSTDNYAVQGLSSNNYGGYFYSTNYRGLYASSPSGWYAGYFVDRGGSGHAGLYVDGTIVATGSKAGYVVDLAVNDGPEPLETGDVVVVTGYAAPVIGEIPLVKVRKCSTAGSSGVVGIVDQPMIIKATQSNRQEDLPRPAGKTAAKTDGTAVGTGQYATVVTLGSFKAVKADASGGPIKPGDLLVASPNAGYAMKSASPAPGTIIGKALGELASGSGVIPVMVTLH